MSLRRSLALTRHELRLLRRDPVPLVVLVCMPLVLMYFLRPVYGAAGPEAEVSAMRGAQQAVPGLTVLFAFFLVGNVGLVFFREHAWRTWDRLRASAARPAEVIAGKVLAPMATYAVQLGVLLTVGGLLFRMPVRGAVTGLVLVALAFALALVAFGLLLVSVCRSVMQMNAVANLGALLLSGVAGALVPFHLLPGWVQTVAPATPGYWAMAGFHGVIVRGGAVVDVAVPVAVLLGFAVAMGALAATRFRFEETKVSWS